MAGIENITNVIAKEAEAEAASIISSAEKSAEEARKKAEAEAKKYLDQATEKTDRKINSERKKIQSQSEQIEKLKLLDTKQRLIEETLLKAKQKVLGYDDKEYFATLLKLLENAVLADKGIMFMNKKDQSRMPSDFEKEVNGVATKFGGMLDISDEAADIDGGFILKYGNIEINSSIDAVFDEKKEKLVDIVNSVLFG